MLSERLSRLRALHPAVAGALDYFATSASVRDAVRQSGFSHRRFVALFRRSVGLGPKSYTRVLRFQKVLSACAVKRLPSIAVSWAELALAAGYSDQAHFNREFRRFTGMTPEAYLRAAPDTSHHVRCGAERG